MARLEDLSIGDTVSWSIPKPPQEDSIAHGVISSLNREDETARIKVWAILENGSHQETDRTVEIEVSRLRKINDFRDEMKQVSATVEKTLREKEKENKQMNLFRNLKQEVETGANGTQEYVIKKGINKDKISKAK